MTFNRSNALKLRARLATFCMDEEYLLGVFMDQAAGWLEPPARPAFGWDWVKWPKYQSPARIGPNMFYSQLSMDLPQTKLKNIQKYQKSPTRLDLAWPLTKWTDLSLEGFTSAQARPTQRQAGPGYASAPHGQCPWRYIDNLTKIACRMKKSKTNLPNMRRGKSNKGHGGMREKLHPLLPVGSPTHLTRSPIVGSPPLFLFLFFLFLFLFYTGLTTLWPTLKNDIWFN